MTKTQQLLEEIKDENLSRESLENYYSKICEFRGQLAIAIADLVKKEALFLGSRGDESVASAKIKWKVTNEGQKLIEYKALATALSSAERGIKNRIYSKL